MIEGIEQRRLEMNQGDSGYTLTLMRCTERFWFNGRMGELSVVALNGGSKKAWYHHERSSVRVVCIHGMVEVAMFDDRKDSETHGESLTAITNEWVPLITMIPKQVHYGFQGLSNGRSLIVIVSDALIDNDSCEPNSEIAYEWTHV